MVIFPFHDIESSLISLLIGGLVGRELFRILDKPNVTIQYRKPITFRQEDGQFLSIRVGNIGRNAAEQCSCTLTVFNLHPEDIVDPAKAEAFENLHEYREEKIDLEFPRYQIIQPRSERDILSDPLCWASLGNPPQVQINPGTTQTIDICKLFRNGEKEYFIFPSESGWRRVRIRVAATARLRCRILVCPANDYPTPLDFEIFAEDANINFRRIRPSLWARTQRFISKRSLYTK